jgi:predicted acyl esterase
MHRIARRAPSRARAAILLALAATIATFGASPTNAGPEPAPEPAVPTFVNGLSQAVFPTGSANWVNHELWVETSVDSDFDGKLDRIHVDVSRVRETDTENLKVPVIYETSPYYGGDVPVVNWAVDHELGFPPATRPVASPTFFNTSPVISTSFENAWVPRGFAVVHAEGLGSGNSDGCSTSGGRNETLGPKAVVDWLNGRATGYTTRTGTETVSAYWTTGKVGMIGTSYNGTLPIGVATTGVQGLEAIVPISAISNWYDYYRANGAVRAPGGFQGEDLDVLAEYTYTRSDQQICRPVIADLVAKQDRVTGDSSPFWEERNYMNDVNNVHAATLLAHGNNDFNVMTKNAAQFYDALKRNSVPHQFYFHQGGHGGSPPDVMLNRWFTRYLYGVQNGVEALPKSWVVREADQCPPRTATVVGDQSNVSLLTVASTAQLDIGFTLTVPQTNSTGTITTTTRLITAVPDATHVQLVSPVATATGQRVADGTIVSLVCGTQNPTPYPEWPDPASAPAELNLGGGAPGIGALTFQAVPDVQETLVDNATLTSSSLANATSSPNRLAFRTAPLSAPVRISGTPTLSLRMAFSKAKANLSAWLVSYPATGNGTILTRGWIDPENRHDPHITEPITPGAMYRLDFDFQPKDTIVAAGRRLGVVIVSSDRDHSIRPAPGTELTLDLDESHVTLPIVGGARALGLATGVVAPAVSFTLDPAAPTGANGWYTDDVSLTWNLADGGAALAKTGCVNETFATDGVFERSCAVANVVGSAGPVAVTVKRDATTPAVSVTGVTDGAVYVLGTEPAPGCATSDATSGVATAAALTLTGGPTVGYFTALCSGALDNAGNAGSASATYQVVYDWRGLRSPLGSGVNTWMAGAAVPVKFSLAGFQGLGIFVAGSPSFQRTNCTTGAAIGQPFATTSTEPLAYENGAYVYVWKTPKSLAGACGTLRLALIDGTVHTASFAFTK